MAEKVRTVPELTGLAMLMQEKYHKLLAFIQNCCTENTVKLMQTTLRTTLQEKSVKQLSPAVMKYKEEIDKFEKPCDVFKFLVEHHFIGYLNFQLLKEFSSKTYCGGPGSKEAKKKLVKYEKLYRRFIETPQFCHVIQVFDENPHLNPSTIIGLPIIVVSLTSAWKHRSMRDLSHWLPFLQEHKCLLQSMGYKCILITYAVFPINVPAVVKFMDDHNNLQTLKKNGITIEVSMETYEMAQAITESLESSEEEEGEESYSLEERCTKLEDENKELKRENSVLKKMLTQVTEKQEEMQEQIQHIKKLFQTEFGGSDKPREYHREDSAEPLELTDSSCGEEEMAAKPNQMEERRRKRHKGQSKTMSQIDKPKKEDKQPIFRRRTTTEILRKNPNRDSGFG